ncbi:hypothetical protein CsSME_00038020 [Camellia sinensis var. sinensis]
MNIIWWRNNEGMLRMLYVLFLGQVVSFIMVLASFTSSLVANLGTTLCSSPPTSLSLILFIGLLTQTPRVDTPLTLSFFGYLSLALVYGNILLYQRQQLLVPWYWYVLLSFIDVQGNYLFNKAYEYSSITSVTLLDCWTIPWVIVLTGFIMATRYSLWQLFGAAICVTGLCLVLLSDAGVGGGGGSKPLLGDLLVIAATLFYAMSNVGEFIY